MTLLEPGSARAGPTMGDAALIDAMIAVESAWLRARGHPGIEGLVTDTTALIDVVDRGAELAGNPVVPLVAELRSLLEDAGDQDQASALHRGLTSQDVFDTALVLTCRHATGTIAAHLARAVAAVRALAAAHRDSVRCGRTLTQPAVPTTFGAVAATWLHAVLDATEDLLGASDTLPLQLGGAAGTLAGPLTQLDDPAAALAALLGLEAAPPWHVNRAPITRFADALVRVHDACGLIANDVLVGARPEIGELREGAGGGSSTMPHKHNPVLSVLIRGGVIAAPGLGATLHAAAAAQVDQRADGGWHAEWRTLGSLVRSTAITASRLADLTDGLVVDVERMRTNVAGATGELLSEAHALGSDATTPAGYLGAAGVLTDAAIERVDGFLAIHEVPR
ncbi:MAG TPA: lyase family protein [Marmoricola sp.]